MAIRLSEMQKSALLEAGNIGSGHAAIALSQLMGKKIMIAIPSVALIEISDLSSVRIDGDGKYALVSLVVLGDIKGVIVFTVDERTAYKLCDIVMGQPKGTTNKLGEIETSAVTEVGSIICASYLNALGEMTLKTISVSVPEFVMGSRAKLEEILGKIDGQINETKQVFCIRTEFIEASEKIEAYLIFMPSGNATQLLIDALGV